MNKTHRSAQQLQRQDECLPEAANLPRNRRATRTEESIQPSKARRMKSAKHGMYMRCGMKNCRKYRILRRPRPFLATFFIGISVCHPFPYRLVLIFVVDGACLLGDICLVVPYYHGRCDLDIAFVQDLPLVLLLATSTLGRRIGTVQAEETVAGARD